jgi:hypothetical protein
MTELPYFDVISVPKHGTLNMIFSKNKLVEVYTGSNKIACDKDYNKHDAKEYRLYNTSRNLNINVTNTLGKDLSLATKNISVSKNSDTLRSYSTRTTGLYDIKTTYPIVAIDWEIALKNYNTPTSPVNTTPAVTSIINTFYQSTKLAKDRIERIKDIASTLKKQGIGAIFTSFQGEDGEGLIISAAHTLLILDIFSSFLKYDTELIAPIKQNEISSKPLNLDICTYDNADQIIDRYHKKDFYILKCKDYLAIIYINQTSRIIINTSNVNTYMAALYCNQIEIIINNIYNKYTLNLSAWMDDIMKLYNTRSIHYTDETADALPYGYELANRTIEQYKAINIHEPINNMTAEEKSIRFNLGKLGPQMESHSVTSLFVIAGVLQRSKRIKAYLSPDLSFHNNTTVFIGNYVRDYLKFYNSYVLPYHTFKPLLLNANKIKIQHNSLHAFSNDVKLSSNSKNSTHDVHARITRSAQDNVTSPILSSIIQNYKITSSINITNNINYLKIFMYTAISVLFGALSINLSISLLKGKHL